MTNDTEKITLFTLSVTYKDDPWDAGEMRAVFDPDPQIHANELDFLLRGLAYARESIDVLEPILARGEVPISSRFKD